MKTINKFFIALAFVAYSAGAGAQTVDSGTCGDNLTWTLTGSGNNLTLTISGTGDMENFDYDPWYSQRENIKTLVIDDGVMSIGNYAFAVCESLKKINVDKDNPNYSSNNGMLYNKQQTILIKCPAGKTGALTIPNSVTAIGDYAFHGCRLTSVTIPNSVVSIGKGAFQDCSGLTGTLTIPNSVTSIGRWAFSGCESLISVTISNSITLIEDNTFWACAGLTSITIPNSVTAIGGAAFTGCKSLTEVTIPNSVASIESCAFSRCESLISVTIPNSVTLMGYRVFWECSNLKSIICKAISPPIIGFEMFPYDVLVYVPCKSLKNYREDFLWSMFKYGECIK